MISLCLTSKCASLAQSVRGQLARTSGIVMARAGIFSCLTPMRSFSMTRRLFCAEKKVKEARFGSVRCPECGKKFLSASNLFQHRRSRHLVILKSPAEVRLEGLRESNARLLAELQEIQKSNTLVKTSACKSSSENSSGELKPAFPAAVPENKVRHVTLADVEMFRDHPARLGTGISEVSCVGVVVGDIEVGFIGGDENKRKGPSTEVLEVLQFNVRVEGYRDRRNGQLKVYRNVLLVRQVFPRQSVRLGDVLLITGKYGLHKSYDMVSKQSVENVLLEADYVGFLGISSDSIKKNLITSKNKK